MIENRSLSFQLGFTKRIMQFRLGGIIYRNRKPNDSIIFVLIFCVINSFFLALWFADHRNSIFESRCKTNKRVNRFGSFLIIYFIVKFFHPLVTNPAFLTCCAALYF